MKHKIKSNKNISRKKISKNKKPKSNKTVVYKKIKSIARKSKIKLVKFGKSHVGDKKFFVTFEKNNRLYNINFGNKKYEDFTFHKDKNRRKRYLARATNIRDKFGHKTYKKITSPNFWSVNVLW